ncbi:MAG: alpha amylase C-terminal domain-containing protein [Planctomycetota bacterium]|jgi:1,4-alpha-glucan branching enzyme
MTSQSVSADFSAFSEEVLRRDYPWRYFGAQVHRERTHFRIYLPEATEVILLRDGNEWGGEYEPLTNQGDGVWVCTVNEDLTGTEYKYRIRNDHEYREAPYDEVRLDPYSFQVATREENGGRHYNTVVVNHDGFEWGQRLNERGPSPMSIYELHLGAFCEDNYRVIAEKIVGHVGFLEFTHVQIMPPFQTPIHESWGYLVGTPYAVYNRHGSLDDFKWLVNHLHEHGLGVVVDLPIGFSIQDWDCGIAKLDGTDLYHHAGEKGWNQQWQTRIYNHDSEMVRNYLTGLAAYLHLELGVDGARIDAVSAQIFRDYDRGDGPWERNEKDGLGQDDWDLINGLGGDRHFEDRGYWLSETVDLSALRFLREFHERLTSVAPHFFTIAEESRRVFPRLATPVAEGGLGFTYAQNMGEMHRVRRYLSLPTHERKIEEIESIMLDPHPETFVNAMNTHDECANGRARLITELHDHVKLVGLAALCWFRPGAPMLFMGDEFCEEGYFDVFHYLDWSKTGPSASLHQQQMTHTIKDLNHLVATEPALARQASWSMDRNGSNNEEKWFSFIRWGGEARWNTAEHGEHSDDIIFIRSENEDYISRPADIYVPVEGEYRVIFNSVDERYIGTTGYNRHDPYWTVWSSGHFLHLQLLPRQNIALKLVE